MGDFANRPKILRGAFVEFGISIPPLIVVFQFNPLTVAAAVVFSLIVGVVFGVWPARMAARLDPIASLRYE